MEVASRAAIPADRARDEVLYLGRLPRRLRQQEVDEEDEGEGRGSSADEVA